RTPDTDDPPVDALSGRDANHWNVIKQGLPGRAYITAEDYWDRWFELGTGNLAAMKSIFGTGVQIEFFQDTYEPNDTQATAKPVVADGRLYHNTFFTDPTSSGSGSGGSRADLDWFSFPATNGVQYKIETINLLS